MASNTLLRNCLDVYWLDSKLHQKNATKLVIISNLFIDKGDMTDCLVDESTQI